MDTKTEELLKDNNKPTSRHSKPKKQHNFPDIDIDINFNSPRITLMIIIFLMMLTVGFLNSNALNTITIICFIVAELLAMIIPEIVVKR